MIKRIYWQFLDEVDGVSDYVDSAAECKETDWDLSSMYLDMAKAEVGHAEKLLGAMKKIAADEKKKSSEDPDYHFSAVDILIDIMNGQLVKARAMMMAFE